MKRLVFTASLLLLLLLCACGAEELPGTSLPPLTLPTGTALPTAPPHAMETPAPPTPSALPTPLPDARALTLRLAYDGAAADTLLDGDYETKRALPGGAVLSLSAEEEIGALYVIWDLPPGEWTADTQICGEDGFLHEFVTLASPARELTVTLPAAGATLCDIFAFSHGAPPDWVQQWLPPWEEADMLLLPTHADDEHLFFGGIMPHYAGELGVRVQVAYLTNHWNAPPRPHELLNGLWTVGITAYPVISGFNDLYAGSLATARELYPLDSVLEHQVFLLRRFKPLVVINHDLNGEYGHGVHMLNAHAIQEAVGLAADSENYPDSAQEYGVWDTPKLYLHLYPDNEIIMNWDVPLARFDGATAFEMAVAGYDCHLSQHQWSFAVRQEGDPYDCRRFGLVRSLVGADIAGDDLMENVTARTPLTPLT